MKATRTVKWIFVILVVLFLISPPRVFPVVPLPLDTKTELYDTLGLQGDGQKQAIFSKQGNCPPEPQTLEIGIPQREKTGVLMAIPSLLKTCEKGQDERFLETSISTVNTFCEKFEGYKEYRECVDDLLEEFLL